MISRKASYLLQFCMAAVLLAACGGPQPPIAIPGAIPQSSRAVQKATSGDLLYVSTNQGLSAYTFPKGQLVNSINLSGFPEGICSDKAGNVWVPAASGGSASSNNYEFAHGGTSPIATLSDSGQPVSCSVDGTSGDLAIGDWAIQGSGGDIAIFKNASGSPTVYSMGAVSAESCSYDSNGNLFIGTNEGGGWDGLWELPKGGSQLVTVSLNQQIGGPETDHNVQWDGQYLAITETKLNKPTVIYRFSMSGSSGTLQSTVTLKTHRHNQVVSSARSTIYDHAVFMPGHHGELGFWRYPRGGLQWKHIVTSPSGLAATVSVSP